MADHAGEKTEAPTPKRRQEARNKGQVAKSQDLPAAIITFAALCALQSFGPSLWQKLLVAMRAGLSAEGPVRADELIPTAGAMAESVGWAMVPLLLIVFIAALVTLYWQVGLLFTWYPVTPSLKKLNPLQGIKRMFSPHTFVATLLNVGKMTLMVAVVYWSLAGGVGVILHSMNMDHVDLYVMAAGMLLQLGFRLAAVMLLLGLADYAYQRHRHNKDMKMTKEEVREELKHMEGDPVMKRRRREVQMKLAAQRIQRDVPKADVVITNPTHLSIALRYDPLTMAAPKVVAKGADWLAYRIRQVAAAYRIPIVERKELARMMYDAVDVGQEVPERFYEAIAEVLAYVYELSGRNMRPRPAAA